MIEILGEHSVDTSLLTKGNICVDIGCLGFGFSKAMRDKGLEVWAFDIQDMEVPKDIVFQRAAIVNFNGIVYYSENNDKQATFITTVIQSPEQIKTRAINLNTVYDALKYQEKNLDILKLDCEGTEYSLLSDENFQPLPKQISVEFHEHAFPELHKQYYDKCMENLLKYYNAVKHERTSQHGAGYNYWDSLFIRKDIDRDI